MASSHARTAVRQPGHRTNSLGYAKRDCHTCSDLKRICDRQRPRCGPCLSNRQRCGGFATNLVWKDVEVPLVPSLGEGLAPGYGTGSPKLKFRHRQLESGTKNRAFKFVKGRMKRRRTPKLPSSEQESPSAADDISDVDLKGQNSQPAIHLPQWFANPETVIDLSARTEEECILNLSDFDRLASELSKCGLIIQHSHFVFRR